MRFPFFFLNRDAGKDFSVAYLFDLGCQNLFTNSAIALMCRKYKNCHLILILYCFF